MATVMDISSARWLYELETDEFNIHQYCLNSSVGELEEAQDTVRKSFPSLNPANYNDFSHDFNEEKPPKLLKTDHISPKLPSSSLPPPEPRPSSLILSFENFGSNMRNSANYPNLIVSLEGEAASPNQSNLLEGDQMIASQNHQGIKRAHPMSRSKSHAQYHLIAERKRREKLTQRFVALSAMVPGLKKMDKASVLGGAIKYMNHLHERVKKLEEQMKKRTVESVVLVKKSQLFLDDQFSSSDENPSGGNSHSGSCLPEIEVRASGKDVLIKILCEKQKGHATKILAEIEKLRLSIINSSVLPFGATLNITVIAEKEGEFDMTLVDIMKSLRLALSNFM